MLDNKLYFRKKFFIILEKLKALFMFQFLRFSSKPMICIFLFFLAFPAFSQQEKAKSDSYLDKILQFKDKTQSFIIENPRILVFTSTLLATTVLYLAIRNHVRGGAQALAAAALAAPGALPAPRPGFVVPPARGIGAGLHPRAFHHQPGSFAAIEMSLALARSLQVRESVERYAKEEQEALDYAIALSLQDAGDDMYELTAGRTSAGPAAASRRRVIAQRTQIHRVPAEVRMVQREERRAALEADRAAAAGGPAIDPALAVILTQAPLPEFVLHTIEAQIEIPATELDPTSFCAICQDEDEPFSNEGDNIATQTHCGHIFHRHCLRRSLEGAYSETSPRNLCPVCRAPIQMTQAGE